MAFNIANFNENINRHGVLFQNKFEVQIQDRLVNTLNLETGQPENRTLFTLISARMGLNESEVQSFGTAISIHKERIDNCRLPGLVLDTYDTRRYGVGPSIRTATNIRFDTFSVAFLTDEQMKLHNFIYTWMRSIFDFTGTSFNNSSPTYLTGYKDEYSTTITVGVFDNGGFLRSEYQFLEAFPVALSDPSLGWRDNNSLHRFMVNFSYTNWKVQNFTTT